MEGYRITIVGVGLLSAMTIAGCNNGGPAGDYATRSELDSLRTQYAATHDTMRALWKATDSMNRTIRYLDTIPRPPRCPPRCLNTIPPVPEPYGR